MNTQEPYLAMPATVQPPVSAGTSDTTLLTLAAVAIPSIITLVLSKATDRIFDSVLMPTDPKKERDKLFRDTHKAIAASSLERQKIVETAVQDIHEARDSDPAEWIDHVERAKEELNAAHSKVKCGKCKKDIEELKDNIDSKTGELVSNARRHITMVNLQKAGKIKEGKTWNTLSAREKTMVKKSESSYGK